MRASSKLSKSSTKHFQKKILEWYRTHGRMLPWRRGKTKWGRDPYRVLVSEVMLQQTQVDRVLPYYKTWIRRWPTVGSLARARLASVIKAWAGLGYNRRAVYLHEAAKKITSEFGDTFPRTDDELMKLPGVGRYTARAIRTFAYGEDVGVLETNTKRVLLRVFLGVSSLREFNGFREKELLELADAVVPKGKGDVWNQAMMDFGALVCTAKNPKCEECPLQTMCKWCQLQTQSSNLKTQNHSVKVKTRKLRRIKFKETDRYFRGRIVDVVRQQSVSKNQLRTLMGRKYGLSDRDRFDKLVGSLVSDGLIAVSGMRVSLP